MGAQGDEEIVEPAPRDALEQHDEEREDRRDEHGLGASRAGEEEERKVGAEKGDQEEGERSLEALDAVRSLILELPVANPHQRRDGVCQRQHEDRDYVKQPVAATEDEEDGDGHGEVDLTQALAPDAVHYGSDPAAQPPDRARRHHDAARQDRQHDHRPDAVEDPGEGQYDQSHPDVDPLAQHLRVEPAPPLGHLEARKQEPQRGQDGHHGQEGRGERHVILSTTNRL